MSAPPYTHVDTHVQEHRFDVAAGGRLYVGGAFQHVALAAGEVPHVRVVARLRGPQDALRRAVHAFVARQAGPDVRIEAPAAPFDVPGGWRGPVEVDVEVSLPPALPVELRTAGAEVVARGLGGSLACDVSGGSLRLEQLRGDIRVAARHGAVIARDLEGPSVTLHTAGGALDAARIRTPRLDVQADGGWSTLRQVEGTIRLSVAGSVAEVEAVRGAVTADVAGGTLALAPGEAAVHLHVSAGLATLYVAPSRAADVRLEGPDLQVDAALAFTGSRRDGRLEGRLHAGGLPLHAYAAAGRLRCTEAKVLK